MKKLFFVFVLFVSLFIGNGFVGNVKAQGINDLKIMTEDFPPFNFVKNGKTTGISVEILAEMLKRAGSSLTVKDIKVLPWARGYALVQKENNACLFSMMRTKAREKLFKWVGPIVSMDTALIGLASKNIKINGLADMKKYKIETILEDVGEQLLLEKGMKKSELDRMSGSGNLALRGIKKLKAGRVDLFAYDIISIKWVAKKNGIDPGLFKKFYILDKGALYFAFNKNVPDSVIQKLQKALDSMKKDGTYQKILDKYLK